MLDGPQGCDHAYRVMWFRICMLWQYLAYRPSEVGRIQRLLDMFRERCPEHGPVHLPVAGASGIGVSVGPTCLAGCALGCFVRVILLGLCSIFQSAILNVWRNKVSTNLFAQE